MKTTSQFVEPEIGRLKNYKYVLNNWDPLIVEPEFWGSLEDPFIDKLITKIEKINRFQNCFDVEVF